MIMVLALFLFGTNYQNNLILLLSFFVFSVFVFIMHLSHFNLSGLKLEAQSAKPVAVGETLEFLVAIDKDGERTKEGLSFVWSNLRKGSVRVVQDIAFLNAKKTLCFNFSANKRGAFQPKWLKVTTYAPIGFFRVWAVMRTNAESWVYPKAQEGPLPIQLSDIGNAGAGEEDWQVLNEYQQGDSLSRLYWRRYALNRELWVRGEYQESQQDVPELPDNLILDFDAPCLQGFDKEERLSILTYWVKALEQQHKTFALKVASQQTAIDSGKEHFFTALKLLAFA